MHSLLIFIVFGDNNHVARSYFVQRYNIVCINQ